jgi:hypothetical protein
MSSKQGEAMGMPPATIARSRRIEGDSMGCTGSEAAT